MRPLGEIAQAILGQSPPSSSVSDLSHGLPFIQGNSEFGARHPTPRFFASDARKVAAAGDVLLSVRAPVGEVNIAEGPLCIGRGVAALRARACDPNFLFYAVGGLAPVFARLSQGSTFDAINGNELRQIEMPIPPLDEQRRIARVLQAVDEAILAASRATEQAARTYSQVLDALLGPYSSSSLAPNLPISAVCNRVTYGFTNPMPTTDIGPWMITALNVKNGQIDYETARHTAVGDFESLTEKSRPQKGSVLVTKDGTLGRVAVVDRDDICVNQSVAVLVPIESLIIPDFLSYLLQSGAGQRRMLADSGGGSVKHIYITKLAAMLISVPSLGAQLDIVDEISRCTAAVRAAADSLKQLQDLRAEVLRDLLTGRVRVPA